jgi:hypothetical protein
MITDAYTRLTRAGLRVSIPVAFSPFSNPPPVAVRVKPAPGRTVAQGSVVKVKPGSSCCTASIEAPNKQPTYRVPDFVGRWASAALAWVRRRTLLFDAYLGPLRTGSAGGLFQNYRVTRQWPTPGAKLRYGKGAPETMTPLSIWGHQPQ